MRIRDILLKDKRHGTMKTAMAGIALTASLLSLQVGIAQTSESKQVGNLHTILDMQANDGRTNIYFKHLQ